MFYHYFHVHSLYLQKKAYCTTVFHMITTSILIHLMFTPLLDCIKMPHTVIDQYIYEGCVRILSCSHRAKLANNAIMFPSPNDNYCVCIA